MPLTAEDVASIATVENYIHDEQQAYLMLYGEGLFDTIPIEQDYTVADIKLWIKHHKELAADKYDLVGPWPRWKMGHGSKILPDDTLVSDVMGERFENKWLMQLSLFPKERGLYLHESNGGMYPTSAYYASRSLVELVTIVLFALTSACISYEMFGLNDRTFRTRCKRS